MTCKVTSIVTAMMNGPDHSVVGGTVAVAVRF